MSGHVFTPDLESLSKGGVLARIGLYTDKLSAIREGFPYSAITRLSEIIGLNIRDVAGYAAISATTLQRRSKAKRFDSQESDRLYCIAEIFERAIDLYDGDEKKARVWVVSPNRGLDGKAPLELSSSAAGTETVLDLIGRIEHGVMV